MIRFRYIARSSPMVAVISIVGRVLCETVVCISSRLGEEDGDVCTGEIVCSVSGLHHLLCL